MAKVAVVDVGSNAIRLLYVEVNVLGIVEDTVYRRYALRLGTDVFQTGHLAASTVQRLVDILAEVSVFISSKAVHAYRVIATSAMRDAHNRAEVLARLVAETGLHVEIISGDEETCLSREALLRAVGSVPPETALVDLGGGSMEVGRADDSRRMSLPLGTVRLLATYRELSAPICSERLRYLAEEFQRNIEAHMQSGLWLAKKAVGTGGNLVVLADLVPGKLSRFPVIDVGSLLSFAGQLSPLTHAEKMARYQLRDDRADLILPAVLVVWALGQVMSFRSIVVPSSGLREGLLLQMVEAPLTVKDFNFDGSVGGAARAQFVKKVSYCSRVFDGLAPLHGLWPVALNPLLCVMYLMMSSVAKTESLFHLQAAATVDSLVDRRTHQFVQYMMTAISDASIVPEQLSKKETKLFSILMGLYHLTTGDVELITPRVWVELDEIVIESKSALGASNISVRLLSEALECVVKIEPGLSRA